MSLFDRSCDHVTSYWRFTVTVYVSCIVSDVNISLYWWIIANIFLHYQNLLLPLMITLLK